MKIGSWKKLSAAAVVAALAVPGFAQETGGESPAGQTGGARSSNAGQNDAASGVGRDRTVIDEDSIRIEEGESGTRTANFPPQGEEGQAEGQQGRGQRGQLNDQGLVRWIAAGNEAEIRVNEVAQQQAENEQVKQFAQKMVDEHTKLGQKLQQAAQGGRGGASGQPGASGRSDRNDERSGTRRPGDAGASERGSSRRGGEEESGRAADDGSVSFLQDDQRDAARGQGRAGGAMRGGNSPFLTLHEEIKRQCAESTIQALKEKQGAEFDHAFMHQQVVEHMAMLDTLKVAEKHASQNLKPAIQEAQQHTQQHLEEAKQIVMQLDQQK